MRAPPPKMRDLKAVPELETPANPYRGVNLSSGANVRHVEPEDVYDDRNEPPQHSRSNPNQASYAPALHSERFTQSTYSQAPPVRHISNTSTAASTAASGSENWETYDDNSEPEPDASDTYYAKIRAARGKRLSPEVGHNQAKRYRGIPPSTHAGHVTLDREGNRIISASEWTDEDAF